MKVLLLLVVIATVSAGTERSTRHNLVIGGIGTQDRLLYTERVFQPRQVSSQTRPFRYTAPSGVRITAIRANEVQPTQFATARVISGGVSHNFVNIDFRNAPGGQISYFVQIWGR